MVDRDGPPTARVLHVINGEHYSGAERVQDLLAGSLASFGFPVGLACVKPDRFPGCYRSRQAPLFMLPMQGRLDPRPARRLARLVRSEGFKLLHAHTPRTLMIAAKAARATATPLVYHVHSPAARDAGSGRGFLSAAAWRNRTNAWVERWSLRRAAAVIAVSESLAGEMRRCCPPDCPVVVVHNGVPCRPPRTPRPAENRDWTLGMVALFRPRKGTEVLLESLASLRSLGWAVRLRAVGGFETDAYRRSVQRLAANLGLIEAIDWVGFTREVDTELDRMDVLVLPSLFGEGLPMVVLEAMAAGVPVVATRVEGTAEAVRDTRDGLIAEPGSAASLTGCLDRILSGAANWDALRRAARERQARSFSDRSMASGVAEVYRGVLSRRRAP